MCEVCVQLVNQATEQKQLREASQNECYLKVLMMLMSLPVFASASELILIASR